MKYNELTLGQMEAIVNKLGGMEGVNDFLSGKTKLVNNGPKWIERDGRIYFELTTLGLTAEEWKSRLTKAGHIISTSANYILSKPDFDKNHRYQPGRTLKVVLIRGKETEKDYERLTKDLKAIAIKDFGENSVSGLKGELSLLIREKFTNKELEEMGLQYIAVLHEPIGGRPFVLYSRRYDSRSWVDAGYDSKYYESAFAFLQD